MQHLRAFVCLWPVMVLALALALVASGASDSDNKDEIGTLDANDSEGTNHSELGLPGPDVNASRRVKKITNRFHLFVFDFERVGSLFSVAVFMLIVAVARMLFHLHSKLPSYVPESCLLIVLGVIAGVMVHFVGGHVVHLDPDTFFLLLLPPIVLDAGFFMNTRALFDNMGTVALFAGLGTVFNTLAIGFSLHFCSHNMLGLMQIDVSLLEALLFASLIAAVDPVAVLALFEEINVNEELYIIVFGESLFNDAVSVVFFNMFYKLNEIQISSSIILSDYVYAGVSMFTGGFIGSLIGVLMGLAVAFVTRFTDHIRVLEPVYAFLMTYIAYLTAEMFHCSGILAAVFCGMVMKRYVQANMSRKSYTTVKYFLKMVSSMCESIVFMYMGLTTVNDVHRFAMVNYRFIGLTLIFCLVYRALGVVLLTRVANIFRIVRLSFVDQFVMSYGGLRGAVAISLAMLVNGEIVIHRDLFTTSAIVVVYFTVFIQGFTIRPLVTWLNVKRDEKRELSMNAQLHLRVMDHAMVGIEDVIGVKGHHRMRYWLDHFNYRYLQRILLREQPQTRESALINVISKLNIKNAVEYIEQHGSLDAYSSTMHLNHSAATLHLSSSTKHLVPPGRLTSPARNLPVPTYDCDNMSNGTEADKADQGITFTVSPPKRKLLVPKISIDSTTTSAASKWKPLTDVVHVTNPQPCHQDSEDPQLIAGAKLNWQRLRTAAKLKVIIAQAALQEHEETPEKPPVASNAVRRGSTTRTESVSSSDSARLLRDTLMLKKPQAPFGVRYGRSFRQVDQDDVGHHEARTAFLQAVNELHILSARLGHTTAKLDVGPPSPMRARRASDQRERVETVSVAHSHSLERLPEQTEAESERVGLLQAEEDEDEDSPQVVNKRLRPIQGNLDTLKIDKFLPRSKSFEDTQSDTLYSSMSVASSTFNETNALSNATLKTPPSTTRNSDSSNSNARAVKVKPFEMATLVEMESDHSDADTCTSQSSAASNGHQPKPFRREYIPPCAFAKGDEETIL